MLGSHFILSASDKPISLCLYNFFKVAIGRYTEFNWSSLRLNIVLNNWLSYFLAFEFYEVYICRVFHFNFSLALFIKGNTHLFSFGFLLVRNKA